MSAEHCFVDTNILVYAHDADAGKKHHQAQALIRELWSNAYPPAISTQVLEELYVTLCKKGASIQEANEIAISYFPWEVVSLDKELFVGATQIHQRFSLSFWDSMIVSAAQKARATILYTEDMQLSSKIEGLKITNPFS